MTDIVDARTRSRMMASIGKENTGPEVALRRALWGRGIRGYRLHRRDLPGTPDLAWMGDRLAIFVDGAFWHGHPSAYTKGKSGTFWDRKIGQNIARDRRVDRALRELGWTVIRIWDFEIEGNMSKCVARILRALGRSSPTRGDRR